MLVRLGQRKKGFSTSCLGTARGRGGAIVDAARELGLNRIALAANLSCDPPASLAAFFRKKGIEVAAVQNVVSTGGADERFLTGERLVDPRPADAERAFALTVESAGAARSLAAPRVVVRLGFFPGDELREIDGKIRELFSADGLTAEVNELLARAQAIILPQRETFIDRAARTLHSLLKAEPEMVFCVVNRHKFFEFPDIESAGYIFEDLKHPRLRYWHDVGAAHAHDRLGLAAHDEWLDRFGPLLDGVNLHDALGLESGLPPGAGEIDFGKIHGALPAECDSIIDLGPDCSLAEMRMALGELEKLGF